MYIADNLLRITDGDFSRICRVTIPPAQPRLPITVDSRFDMLRQTRGGRVIYRSVLGIMRFLLWRAKRMPQGQERDNKIKEVLFTTKILETNSLCCMSMNSGGLLPYNVALAAVALANGDIGKMIHHLFHPIKAPKLPKRTKR